MLIIQPERDGNQKKARDSNKCRPGKKKRKTESDSSNSESPKASDCETDNSDSDLEDRRHKESRSKKLPIRDLEELIRQKNNFCEDHNEHCHIMATKGMEGRHIILDHKNIRRWASAVVRAASYLISMSPNECYK